MPDPPDPSDVDPPERESPPFELIEHRQAGWLEDPFARFPFRWWNGEAWTWQVTDDTRTVSWDPVPFETTPERAEVPGIAIAIVGLLAGIGLSAGVQAILAAVGHPGGNVARLLLGQAGLWSGLVAACIVVDRRGERSLRRDFGLSFRGLDVGLGFAGSLAARLITGLSIAPLSVFFRHVRAPEHSEFDHFAHGALGWTSLVFVVCVGAPIIEELFFRGLVQTRLVKRWGPARGIAVTSLFFGAAHLIGWVGPITLAYAWAIAAAGLALGMMRHITGRLGTSMVAHMLFNVQALLALAFIARVK